MKVLPKADARSLLQEGYEGDNLDAAKWDEITEWVGRLPLALLLLKRTLRRDGAEELWEVTRGGAGPTQTLIEEAENLRRSTKTKGVEEAFDYAYRCLPPDVQSGARVIAQLAPVPIPKDLVEALGSEAASRVTKDRLLECAFIDKPVVGGRVKLFGSMHPVLADYLRTLADEPDEELSVACLALRSMMPPGSARDPAQWPLVSACLPHGCHVFRRVARVGQRPVALQRSAVALGLRLAAFLRAQGQRMDAISLFEEVAELSAWAFGSEHRQTLAIQDAQAEALLADGRPGEARTLQENVVRAARSSGDLGPAHPETLSYEAQMAGILAAEGDGEGARQLLEQVIEVTAKVDARLTITYRQDLAVVLAGLGRFVPAYEHQRAVLEAGDVHHLGTRFLLRGRANLAGILAAMDRLDEATSEQRRVVDLAVQVLEPGHPDLLDYQAQLARLLVDQDELGAAVRLLRAVIETAKGMSVGHGSKATLELARWRRDLGMSLIRQAKLREARAPLKQALADLAQLGERNGEVSVTAWTLVVAHLGIGDAAAATEVRRRYLDWLLDQAGGPVDMGQEHVRRELQALHKRVSASGQ